MDIQTQLLENVLDALDRLYDHKLTAIDIHALVYATAAACRNQPTQRVLAESAAKLFVVVRANLFADDEREAALDATGDLRSHLASFL